MESHRGTFYRTALFLLGMASMATQVILIREALAIFHGNELIIGLFMGIWMALTATGALLAVHSSKLKVQCLHLFPLLLFFFSILPLATLFLLALLRYSIVPSGIMPGLGQTALVIFLSLMPFCLLSGMLFPILVQRLSSLKNKNLLHQGYALDAAGSILGGILFSIVFILILPPYESLILLTTLCMLSLLIMAIISKKIILSIIIIIIGTVAFLLPSKPGIIQIIDNKQFNRQKVLEINSSPYGMIAVTESEEGLFVYENGDPVNLGTDIHIREESVHYAMLLHPSPKKILLISGGLAGMLDEILKYPIDKADYIEPNPWLMRLVDKFRPLPEDHRISYIYIDPRIFLEKNTEKYDVILINTPEPNSAEINRFYTIEFYKILKTKLNPGGIISVAVPSSGNYLSETTRQSHSVIYNTLKQVYHNTRIIPGAKDYFLASDSTIEQSIFLNYRNQGFENSYVNPEYINENLVNMRSELIMKDILPEVQINSDLKPYVFSLFLKQWLSKFKINAWIIPLILSLILISALIFLGPLNLGLFAGGFTASSLEFILLIWFQVMYGYVYQMTGVIFAVFMAGLAVGSLFRNKIYAGSTFRSFLNLQAGIAIFSAITASIILLVSLSPGPLVPLSPGPLVSLSRTFVLILILTMVLLTGLITGIQFSMSAGLRKTAITISAGESFSADLMGSAIGIILVSVYVVPQLGLPMTGLLLAGMNLIVLGVMVLKCRQSAVGSKK